MGEIIEISTIRNHQRRFYKFTSKSVIFSVKGNSGYAMVGLADEIGFFNIDHWVFIDKEGKTGVNEFNKVIVETPTPGILDEDKFHKFCLVPPRVERPVLKPIIGGKPYWVPYDGKLPYGAVIGGYEYEFLYIMRAPHEGSLTPGKYVPSMKCGFIGWEGYSHLKTVFEILCGHDCVWVPTKKSVIPAGAIAAGFTDYERETMYIGRVKQNGHIIPGKVAPTLRACYFTYSDKEAYESYYEILVGPHSNPRCTNTLEPAFKERYEFYKEKYKCDENFYI